MLTAVVLHMNSANAQAVASPVIRLAEFEIASAQLARFSLASREHVSAASKSEPGVLALHVAAEKDRPTRLRVLEVYADAEAYSAQLKSPHYQAFRAAIEGMATHQQLLAATPVFLGAKPDPKVSRPMVRVAEIDIAPAQLDAYKAAVSEEIEASIRLEPGVLAIYAVALQDKPTHLRFFEVYADESAYRQHIASPHFRKYVDTTKAMIVSRVLLEAEPIALGFRP